MKQVGKGRLLLGGEGGLVKKRTEESWTIPRFPS